jgi:hypothetical protein
LQLSPGIDNCRDRHRHFSTLPRCNFPFSIEFSDLQELGSELAVGRHLAIVCGVRRPAVFKISIVETRHQRRLVLEGKLVPPWTAEVESAWRSAGEQLQGRKLIVDLTNVTLISPDGENTLFELMREGAKFSRGDVLTQHVLQQLARRCRWNP